MPEPEPLDEPTVRLFGDWLAEQRKGVLHAELSDALNELVAAVGQTGRGGDLILKVRVKPAAKMSGAVVVTDDVVVKKPAGDRGDALYFIDKHNNLSRENPDQPRLPLREVGQPDTPQASAAKEA